MCGPLIAVRLFVWIGWLNDHSLALHAPSAILCAQARPAWLRTCGRSIVSGAPSGFMFMGRCVLFAGVIFIFVAALFSTCDMAPGNVGMRIYLDPFLRTTKLKSVVFRF